MSHYGEKKIALNAILNTMKTILGIVFPIITFPYVSRVLGAEKLGIYNFSASIVSYFALFAALGVSTYGIREGSQYRQDKDKISEFVSELFSINVISTIISICLLIICLIIVPKLQNYTVPILLLSIEIVCTTMGVVWVCNIYEDFIYITIRSLAFQLFSLIMMFIFVKSPDDIYKYIIILVVANSGASILNAFYVRRKYCSVHLTFNDGLKKHIKPILIIFSTTIAISVYVSSDITMLGFMTSDYEVGLYSTAVKIYSILKNVLVSILVVLIPRFSLYFAKGELDKSKEIFSRIFNILTVIILPIAVGLFMISDDVIILISGEEYLNASNALRLLSVAIVFSLYSYMYTQCVLIPCKREKVVFRATVISALVNIILNFLLLPKWGINAAAITTIIAEIITFIISYNYSKKILSITCISRNFLSSMCGCASIILICTISKTIVGFYLRIIVSVVLSVVTYLIVLYFLKNDSLKSLYSLIKS